MTSLFFSFFLFFVVVLGGTAGRALNIPRVVLVPKVCDLVAGCRGYWGCDLDAKLQVPMNFLTYVIVAMRAYYFDSGTLIYCV